MGRGKNSIPKTNTAASPLSVATSSKKRPASDLVLEGDAGRTTTKGPFLYQLINSLRDFHDSIATDKQALQTILQDQLTDQHPLCHLLIASGGSGSSTHGTSNEPSKKGGGGDESSPAHHFVYWLFLATHCLQKLSTKGIESDGVAVSASWLVYTISRNLLSHLPAKQERLSSVAARHVVGRALILVSIVATEALNHISKVLSASKSDNPSSETTITILSTSLQACVLALDSVTMVQQATSLSDSQLYWNQTVTSLDHFIDRVWNKKVDALQSFISATETLDWSLETCSWQALSTDTVVVDSLAAPSGSTGKRTSRRITGTSTSTKDAAATTDAAGDGAATSLLQTMEPLIKQDVTHKTGLDSRLALKRWTAVGLTWYGNSGQEKLLTVAHRLLQPDTLALFSECWRPVVMGPLPPEEQPDAPFLDEEEDDILPAPPVLADGTPEQVKSKPKKSPQPEESLETPVVNVPVPHNVTLVTIVCQLCHIVWEVGNAAGSRPPPFGGFDTYMKGVTGTVIKKSKKLVRSDLRDLSMSICYLLVNRHHNCMEENYGSNVDKLVINEDDAEGFRRRMQSATTTTAMSEDKEAASYISLYFYYPYVHKAVSELASASASNAEGGQSVLSAIRWSDRIEYAASSFVFLSQKAILDARLTSYALEKLLSSLSATRSETSGITADTATSSTAVSTATSSNKKKTSVKLYEPLPVPSIVQQPAKQTAIRKRRNTASVLSVDRDITQFCSFAGMYVDRGEQESNTELTCDEKVALFIRAVQGEPALVSHLVWIVEACYDTRTIEDPSISSTASTGWYKDENKRKPSLKLSGRANKRRKLSESKAKSKVASVESSGLQYRQIKGLRATVATKALDALQLFLRDPIDETLSDVQSTLVDCVSRDHMYRIIELGSVLEAICAISPDRLTVCEEGATSCLDGAMPLLVNEVKDMWMSHIDLCLTIGKGLSKESLLTSTGPNLRQTLFEKIARDSKRQSSGISWPLSLRPAHRALVLASFVEETSNTYGTDLDGARRQPDRFIVDGFISELTYCLDDLVVSFDGDDAPGLDGFPISLQDVHVFLRALSKVPIEVQKSTLFELQTLVYGCLSKIRSTGSSVFRHEEVCHFFARVVCCCVSTYCVIKFGSSIQSVLGEVISKSMCAKSQLASWYRSRENGTVHCFMSVFSDGMDSGLPPNLVAEQEVAKATDDLLQKLLEQALSLGYITAAVDKCHLLYAAWNALGKCDIWNDYSNTIQELDGLSDDASCLILQLREDMCLVHYKMMRLQGDIDLTSTLIRARDSKARSHRASKAELKSLLRQMVRKGCSVIDAILRKYAHPHTTTLIDDIPIDVFCLLEACCAYISMSISLCTKPKNNFFASTLADHVGRSKGRTRGYSTDSDALPSDAGSVDSRGALGETVERLQEVCEYLGSVPAHPDWLDKDCNLMESVSTDEAIEIANEAMACLTKLVSVGMIQSQLFLKRAVIQALDPNDSGMASMIMHFCDLNVFDAGTHTDAEIRSTAASLGELCGLRSEFLLSLVGNSVSSQRQEAVCMWCPFTAQRILGMLQDAFREKLLRNLGSPELRACGEWEVLLSQSLSSASISTCLIDSGCKLPDDPDLLRVRSERWRVVCLGALDSLVSTVALLRFGISSTGRFPHPLSSTDTYTDTFEFEAKKGSMIEPITNTASISETVKRNLHSALAAVARYPPNATCNAIASHLVVTVESLFTLRRILTSTAAMRTLSELRGVVSLKKEVQPALLSVLVRRITEILDTVDTGGRGLDGSGRFLSLFACLSRSCTQSALVFDTISTENMDPLDILSIDSTSVNSLATNEWDCVGLTSDFTSSVFFLVCHYCLRGFPSTMSFFASALSSLIAMEIDNSHVVSGGHGLLSSILNVVNDLPEATVEDLIQSVICGTSWRCNEAERKVFVQCGSLNGYASLFALLLVSCDGTTFKRTDLVLCNLLTLYDKWKNFERYQRNTIMSITLLYASHHGDLHIIGGKILDDLKRMRMMKTYDAAVTENMMFFAEFVRQLSDTLSCGISSGCEKRPVASLPASCSYATRKDFHEQHWYNCFTCGLTNDKGCCSLCAVVCHRGHDVVYARQSSFFCDCGSEAEPTIQKACLCLSPHACSDFVKQIREGTYCAFVTRDDGEYGVPMQLSALIVKDSFPQVGVSSFNKLMEKVRSDDWVRFLFECTKQEFSNWKTTNDKAEATLTQRNQSVRYSNLRTSSRYQISHLNIRALTTESYTLLGASRSGSFQMRMSNHRSTDRKGLSRHGIGRFAIDADSRGRIAIAESSDISFGTCVPFINATTRDDVIISHSRSTMTSVASKISVGFRVVGVKFALGCENAVCAWGATEAKVLFMANGVTTVDGAVHLELDLSSDDDNSDIVTCCWLEGSGTGLVVGCSQCIYVFEVSHQKGKVSPIAKIPVAKCSSNILDFAIVRISDTEEPLMWKIFVLLENWKVHEATLSLEAPSDAMDISLSLSKASEFIAEIMDDTSVELISITFLVQSSFLLCETRSSGTLALLIDAKGEVLKAIKFLPFNLDPSLFEKSDRCAYHGPFTQWRELGMVCRESGPFFTLSFAGFRSTTDPVLLYLEFDVSGVFIQELAKHKNISVDSLESYEGLAVFTAPIALAETSLLDLTETRVPVFVERIFVCAVSLDGSMQLYAEEASAPSRAALEPQGCLFHVTEMSRTPERTAEQVFINHSSQLISLEKMINTTLSQQLVFGSADIGSSSSDTIKKKFAEESGNGLTSPRVDGFTLSIAMTDRRESPDPAEYSKHISPYTESDDVIIAALRILVGSGPMSQIPLSIRVMGRTHKLTSGQKRWYTFHLSAQEIACSVRNGFVSVLVDKCADSSSHPTLNSIEVYSMGRGGIEKWIPRGLYSLSERIPIEGKANDLVINSLKSKYVIFRLYVTTLGNFYRSMQGSFLPNRTEKETVEHLVMHSALTLYDSQVNESIDFLKHALAQDEESRQISHDRAVLAGCTTFLSKCQQTLADFSESHSDFHSVWRSLIPSVRFCLRTAARIARVRPFNYIQGIDGSIAADASKFVIECLGRTIADDDLVSDFVELSLLETAVANGTPRGNLGLLSGLRILLASPIQAVVLQTCASISRFCRVCDLFAAPTLAVEYECDSCFEFITDTRFTLLEHDHAFDLCPSCYQVGYDFVRAAFLDDVDHVIIKGKAVGDNPKLTWGEFRILQPVATKKALDAADPMTSTQPEQNMGSEVAHKHQLFNDFMDCLFTGIAGLLVEELKRSSPTPSSLVWLAVDLVRHSLSNGRKIEKATQLAEVLAARVCSNLQAVIRGEDWSDESLVLLEALICLFVPDRTVRDFLLGNQPNFVSVDGASNSSVSCDTHGTRVKLRQFTEGRDNGRFFYSCSKDTRNDCNFFLWAEENGEPLRNDKQAEASPFVVALASFVWELLAHPPMSNGTALNFVLCSFVEKFWDASLNERDNSLSEDVSLVQCSSVNLRKGYADGVLCHHERMCDDATQHIMAAIWRQSKSTDKENAKNVGCITAVEKCLELVALCARADTEGTTLWFPVLCRMMLPSKNQNSKSDKLRLLAKRSLKQLCGHDAALSHAVRDHFVFVFYMERLLRCTESVLNYAVMLNEKARQCGPTWKSSSPAAYHLLTVRQFIGTHALISEDTSRLLVNEKAHKALHDLSVAANKRVCSWRRFCGLRSFPASASSSLGVDFIMTPPICSLFAVACTSSAENQATALRLINLALARSGERKQSPDGTTQPKSSDDEKETGIADAITARLTIFYADSGAPEDVLSISIDDVSSFSFRFVCLGQSADIRNLSCSIAKSLCRRFDKPSLAVLFGQLTGSPLGQAGQNGKRSAEFMSLLQAIVIMAGAEAIDVTRYATLFQLHFKQQVLAIRHDRANGEYINLEAITGTSIQKKRYNLSSCATCRFHEPRTKDLRTEKARPSSTRALSSKTAVDSTKLKGVPEQVTSFAKFRLDSNRESTSNEFCSFFLLKHRCVLSGIQVEVENPRRLVKTINFFYSPRPVDSAVLLKSSQFDDNWQQCGVMTLTRGTTRGSLTLTTPVVAANLKIEYAEFYERPGSTKSSDGALIVHCPRCTRVVTNAHGVCGNCGEVAFQCRKCRHINYDRLDAFLCVECGYCASGTFQFDLTAAVATNAVAILNDCDYERSMHKKLVASKMHGEIKSALVQKLLRHARSRKRNPVDEEDDDRFGLDLLPAFARAFAGVLPLDPGEFESDSNFAKLTLNQLGKPGHIVKTVAQADKETHNRPQSLFRSRGESLSNRSRTESLFRIGRDLDGDETASELLGGLLDSTSSLSRFASLDPNDPLSRLLASVQSRRERRDTEEGEAAVLTATTPAVGAATRSPPSGMSSEDQEVCDRLFQLMREAEREAHELEVRCAAWRRLEQGNLGYCDDGDTNGFEPSHCAVCAIPMADHLLTVWLRIFLLNPDAVVIDEEMIALLVNDDPALHHLCEVKRSTIKEIALSSQQGRPMILEALRLRIVLLHNLNAAEILGQILQSFGNTGSSSQAEVAAPFLALAQEALESGLS